MLNDVYSIESVQVTFQDGIALVDWCYFRRLGNTRALYPVALATDRRSWAMPAPVVKF